MVCVPECLPLAGDRCRVGICRYYGLGQRTHYESPWRRPVVRHYVVLKEVHVVISINAAAHGRVSYPPQIYLTKGSQNIADPAEIRYIRLNTEAAEVCANIWVEIG